MVESEKVVTASIDDAMIVRMLSTASPLMDSTNYPRAVNMGYSISYLKY